MQSGLKKKQIPLEARIMSVIDAFDAMTFGRPYKKRLTLKDTIKELEKNKGTQFDPEVVEAFIKTLRSSEIKKYEYIRQTKNILDLDLIVDIIDNTNWDEIDLNTYHPYFPQPSAPPLEHSQTISFARPISNSSVLPLANVVAIKGGGAE